MTEETGEGRARPAPPRPPTQDLFASAVHRFGAVWADLVVASVVALGLATIPVFAVHQGGGNANETALIGRFAYGIAYFSVVGFVMLRGLPEPAPRRRVVWTYATSVMIGTVAGFLLALLGPYAVVPMPLLLFAVPAIAAGDVEPGGAIARSAALAIRNFSRTWLVWLITILFTAPIVVSMALIVYAFADAGTAFLAGLAMAAPIAWPFSALFTRALYGDLTGRNVVAPEDRSL
ncbi:MAG TPA: hypothetical protein VLB81_00445 [Gaiellales bacterium]|nr:hypothetical protein [Gaiellales bacterium]